jgi:hypothetical protein
MQADRYVIKRILIEDKTSNLADGTVSKAGGKIA